MSYNLLKFVFDRYYTKHLFLWYYALQWLGLRKSRGSGKLSSSWSRVNAQMRHHSHLLLPSPPYPWLIESVQPKLAPEGIPIHLLRSASADQGIDISSVS